LESRHAAEDFRPALSDADRDARNLFVYWAHEAGLKVTIDRVGNIFARRDGARRDLPPVMIGSHLDTQTPGGKFDGVLGVLAGLEVVRALDQGHVTTSRSVEIVNWANEEGVRWPGLMGSSVYAGLLELNKALAFSDRQGATVAGELSRIGYAGNTPVGDREIDSYLELHIEQGSVLQARQVLTGAVTNRSWWGRGLIEIHGENGHAQTAPMSRRRNALVGAAKLILGIERIGGSHEPDGIVSVTVADCWPNNWINIPHLSKISFLIVHGTKEGRQGILDQIGELVDVVTKETGLSINNMSSTFMRPPRLFRGSAATDRECGEAAGLLFATFADPGGHDALNMHFILPDCYHLRPVP
jgi:N-carbamoyl-L-amino-acid hydrolase